MRTGATIGSIALCFFLAIVRLLQPDWLVPVTLVPAWLWVIGGVFLLVAGFRRDRVRLTLVGLVAWFGFVAVFVEEARTAMRLSAPVPTASRDVVPEDRVVRVISLNCNVGQVRCVEEALAWHPDILLLQESPSEEALERVVVSSFGEQAGVVYGGDVSILVNGAVLSRPPQVEKHFVQAQVQLPSGAVIEVVSARLSPPVPRLDFWSSSFWREHRQVRERHRREVDAINRSLRRLPAESRVLVGGDFNMPPDDAAVQTLRTELFDVFGVAGRGWGNTGTNDYPLFRVDQIWASVGLQPEGAVAVRTKYSDHRMVVCDLQFP